MRDHCSGLKQKLLMGADTQVHKIDPMRTQGATATQRETKVGRFDALLGQHSDCRVPILAALRDENAADNFAGTVTDRETSKCTLRPVTTRMRRSPIGL